MTNIVGARAGIIAIGSATANRCKAEANSSGIVNELVSFNNGVTTPSPQMNGVLGEAISTPEAFDDIVLNYPASGLVRVNAPV